MSTRQMAQRYSKGGGGGIRPGSLRFWEDPSKKMLQEAQGLSDIDEAAAKRLAEHKQALDDVKAKVDREWTEKLANDTAIHAWAAKHDVLVRDPKGNITPAFQTLVTEYTPLKAKGDILSATGDISKQKTINAFRDSEEGKQYIKAGQSGLEAKPAFEAAKLGEQTVGIGETGKFFNPMSLSAKPTLGKGTMPSTEEFVPSFNTKTGQAEPMLARRTISSPGVFLDPNRVEVAKNLPDPNTSMAPSIPPLQAKPVAEPPPRDRGLVGKGLDMYKETAPYRDFLSRPGDYGKNMLLDLLFGKDRGM